MFLEAFRNPLLEAAGGPGRPQRRRSARLAFTTDSYVVSPLFFPGGDIGDLAVNGTVNDLAMSGARPLYLSCGFILEEGFPVADLERIAASMAAAAQAAGVSIVTGDTKVVQRGKADGCYINTAGVGVLERPIELGAHRCRPGDAIIVSGPIGDHGVTVMLARGELEIESDVVSDTAPLHELVGRAARRRARRRAGHARRHPGRGGHDPQRDGQGLQRGRHPRRGQGPGAAGGERRLRDPRASIPLYVACEGRFVAVVDGDAADDAAGGPPRAHAGRRRARRSSGGSRTTRPAWCCSRPASGVPGSSTCS